MITPKVTNTFNSQYKQTRIQNNNPFCILKECHTDKIAFKKPKN